MEYSIARSQAIPHYLGWTLVYFLIVLVTVVTVRCWLSLTYICVVRPSDCGSKLLSVQSLDGNLSWEKAGMDIFLRPPLDRDIIHGWAFGCSVTVVMYVSSLSTCGNTVITSFCHLLVTLGIRTKPLVPVQDDGDLIGRLMSMTGDRNCSRPSWEKKSSSMKLYMSTS